MGHANDEELMGLQKAPASIGLNKKISSGNFEILDVHPKELARQMTLVEFAYYGKIRPSECLNQVWNKDDKLKLAPNMMALIGRFNRTSYWVATQIVQERILEKRTKILKNFIKVAIELRNLNNFNGIMEVMTGLQTSAVHRMKKTWAGLSKRRMRDYRELKMLLSSDGSQKNLRDALHLLNPPCVPYLGMYLTDLTFIEDGNPDMLGGLVNFDKRYLLARVISEIQLYQHPPYSLRSVHEIQSYLQFLHAISPDNLYDLSLEVEPRALTKRGNIKPIFEVVDSSGVSGTESSGSE